MHTHIHRYIHTQKILKHLEVPEVREEKSIIHRITLSSANHLTHATSHYNNRRHNLEYSRATHTDTRSSFKLS